MASGNQWNQAASGSSSAPENMLEDVRALENAKVHLLNVVSASLIQAPNFNNPRDDTAPLIVGLVEKIVTSDPEFILKLALYVRDDLNIRSTANFLLALSAHFPSCQPFLKKYFLKAVRLPSDWLDVAALYQKLPCRTLDGHAIPTALRKAMVAKFPDFDAYQLGKYNKEGKQKRLAKKEKAEAAKKGITESDFILQQKKRKNLTLKQMVRQLHIAAPPYFVMCILGKKYPVDEDEYRKSGLTGAFNADRAGKRMKLPVPETWETLLSARGNSASTWEQLIDNRKLPFMAMLRNLRNMILVGISPRHHKWVMSRLKDENTIANSRQFPFSFFSAYEALKIDLEDLKKKVQEEKDRREGKVPSAPEGARGGRGRGARGRGDAGRGRGAAAVTAPEASAEDAPRVYHKKVKIPKCFPTEGLLNKYREALDTAVKLATVHNVKPIRGSTIVMCNVSKAMQPDLKGVAGRMGTAKSLADVGVLLGLMCKYMCEECEFILFAKNYTSVTLQPGTILDNMSRVQEQVQKMDMGGCVFPDSYLVQMVKDRKKVDQVIVLSNETVAPGCQAECTRDIGPILQKYRQDVNSDLLYVSVNLSGRGGIQMRDESIANPNDICIAGFSDAILRYIAERGDGNMLSYIQHIDEVKGLKEKLAKVNARQSRHSKKEPKWETSSFWSWMDPVQPCTYDGCSRKVKKQQVDSHMRTCSFRPATCPFEGCDASVPHNQLDDHKEVCPFSPAMIQKAAKRRVARVFVSSTFLDMHGERDVLTRKVFPELRERCRRRRIKLHEVDLRWGVTEEEAVSGSSLEICLSEVDRCRPFFIGMLGQRAGRVKESYQSLDAPQYKWLETYPTHRSITELEMHYGALMVPRSSQGFFYIRDDACMGSVTDDVKSAFCFDSPEALERLQDLKARILEYEKISERKCVYNGYPAVYGGVIDGKPMMVGLESFASRVVNDLWGAICNVFPEESGPPPTLLSIECDRHADFAHDRAHNFIGRREELETLKAFVDADSDNLAVVHGPAGVGKSALLSRFVQMCAKERPGVQVISHFVSASSSSANVCNMLMRICEEIKAARNIPDDVPVDYRDLCKTFERFLEMASYGKSLVLILDGLDQLSSDYRAHNLDWLPVNPPVSVVISADTDSEVFRTVSLRNKESLRILVPVLQDKEKKDLVRKTLWDYRKKLDESPSNNQLRLLCGKPKADLPLWIMVACEELRMFGVFENLTSKIRSLPGTVAPLLSAVLDRVCHDHGAELTRNLLCLLYCSCGGLQESEIVALLARKDEFHLPPAIWRALYRSLEHFLRSPGDEDDGTVDFFHQSFKEAVRVRYMARKPERSKYHQLLANFYLSQADPDGDGTWKGATRRNVRVLPHHLLQAGMWTELELTLCDLAFVELKCKMGMTFDLVRDLHHAAQNGPEGNDWPSGVNQIQDFFNFVSSNSHLIAKKPNLVLQQSANAPDGTAPHSAAVFKLNEVGEAGHQGWLCWLNKPASQDACKMTLSGFMEPFMACDFSPDGSLMVSASRDRTLKVWETHSGAEVVTLSGHTNSVVDCKFSPDGRRIASASWDRTLKLWDVETGQEISTLSGHRRRVSACCFSHDSKFLLSASWDCSLRLWDTEEEKPAAVKYFKAHQKPVNACAFSPDDKRIVSASWDCTVIVWDVETATVLSTLSGHVQSVRSVVFSPDGNRLVSTSIDCTVRIWDVVTGKPMQVMEGHASPVNQLSFCADGRHLVSASDDQTIRVWDTVGGRTVTNIKMEGASSTYSEFFPDGNRIISGQSDCKVVVWDALLGEQQVVMEGHTRVVNQVKVSSDGRIVASVSDDGTARLWSHLGTPLHTLKEHRGAVNACSFSSDGSKLLTCGEDMTLKLWDVATGNCLQTLKGHTNVVKACSYSPDGNMIASVSRDNSIRLWHAESGKCFFVIDGQRDWLTSVSFSCDGRYLVTGAWDFNVSVWDLKKLGRTPVMVLRGHSGAISSCEFSHDSTRIVSASYDGTIKIWNAQSSQLIATVGGHEQRIYNCSFSLDGQFLVSSSDDRSIRIWDAVAGKEVSRLQGHAGAIQSVQFHPDRKAVVSAGQDGTVRVWDALKDSSGRNRTHKDGVSSCQYTPDGRFMVSSSRDHTVKVWYSLDMVVLASLEGHTHTVNDAAIVEYKPGGVDSLEDQLYIASTSDDMTVRLWFVSVVRGSSVTVKMMFVKKSNGHPIKSLATLPGSRKLFAGGWSNNVERWDLPALSGDSIVIRSEPVPLYLHKDWVNSVAVSKTHLASASHDGTVLVQVTGTASQRSLSAHKNWVLDCTFSEDGALLATASYDNSVMVFDVKAGYKTTATLNGHSDRVNACAFLGNGKYLVSGSHDRSVKVWKLGSNDIVAEFSCKGHVTALRTAPGHQNMTFVVGDSLGNVEFLRLEV